MKTKKKNNYIDREYFSNLVIKYNSLCNIHKDTFEGKGDNEKKIVIRTFKENVPLEIIQEINSMEEEICLSIKKIIDRTILLPQYKENDKEEMKSIANEDCMNSIHLFDEEKKTFDKKPNAFSYFTTIIKNAFHREGNYFYKKKKDLKFCLEETFTGLGNNDIGNQFLRNFITKEIIENDKNSEVYIKQRVRKSKKVSLKRNKKVDKKFDNSVIFNPLI